MTSLSAATSIVIPSYRRPDHLRRCLVAVAGLNETPAEVIVVCRRDDEQTRDVAQRGGSAIRIAQVDEHGVLAAMQAGIDLARGDLVALLDDDTQARPDWLGRVSSHFRDPTVGGVCGRDIVTDPDTTRFQHDVGRISWWGKAIGHHHLMQGPVRDVDILKGANVIFRRSALRLPQGLRGRGAQVHWEIASSLWLKDAGLRVLVDPGAEVLHLPGPRFDADRRGRPAFGAAFDAAYNLLLAVCSARPRLLLRRLAYGIAIGDAACPGLLRGLVAVVRRERGVARLVVPSLLGQMAGALRLALGARLAARGFRP